MGYQLIKLWRWQFYYYYYYYYAVFNAPCVGRLDDEIAGRRGGHVKLCIRRGVVKRFQFLLESVGSNVQVASDGTVGPSFECACKMAWWCLALGLINLWASKSARVAGTWVLVMCSRNLQDEEHCIYCYICCHCCKLWLHDTVYQKYFMITEIIQFA